MNKSYSKGDGVTLVWRRFRRSTLNVTGLSYLPVCLNPTASPRAVAFYRRLVRMEERRLRKAAR